MEVSVKRESTVSISINKIDLDSCIGMQILSVFYPL